MSGSPVFGFGATPSTPRPSPAGWYGKLPATGDFVSRRLSPEFVTAWDAFLGDAIAGSKALLGEAWLEHYLASPIWQFVAFPPVCGAGAWVGLMMPSVDRVGRYFPLTICSRLATVPDTLEEADALLDWLSTLEGAALGALNPEATIDDFEAALLRQAELSPLPSERTAGARPEGRLPAEQGLFMLHEGPEMSAWLARAFAAPAAFSGHSLWWSFAVDGDRIPAAVVHGLPGSQSYARMIGGAF
ncbi:MAG: type VI secretion system-associated protein TagF [Rhodocyclaceae bacterium]|nr:type VI secretion system-associated protein TagF [Rhodocyclaceae bacterium]